MNYYKRHLGDYAKDTRHLSLAEHGAYCLLLDYYYSTERPIPDDRCERIANAYTDDERKAVRNVLKAFFTLTDEGWRNARADSEIAEFHAKSLKAKAAAEARWSGRNADAYANASDTHSERNASHKPLAISHKEAKEAKASFSTVVHGGSPGITVGNGEPRCSTAVCVVEDEVEDVGVKGARKARRRAPPKTPMPDDFALSDRVRRWAEAKGFDRLDEHLEAFVAKAKARGYAYADWDAALMEAIRQDWAGLRKAPATHGQPQPRRRDLL